MKLRFPKTITEMRKHLGSERGITAIEYALLAALIAVAIIGGVTLLGTTLDGFFSAIATKISGLKPT